MLWRTIVQGQSSHTERLSQHARHSPRDSEVVLRSARKEELILSRNLHKWVRRAEFEREDGVAEVVPVDDHLGVAQEAHELRDCERGDRRWVLDKHPF